MIDDALASAASLLAGRSFAVLSGAGLSTESGIPDYRGPGTRERARNPIQHRAFLSDPLVRARYWRRSLEGWPRIAAAEPNAGHRAVARLERAGHARGIVTQNVDGLHQRAGAKDVVELHGALARVRCLSCGALAARTALQERLVALNPGVVARLHGAAIPGAAEDPQTRMTPDGDADVDDIAGFSVPACAGCGGVLKPDVVFFGDNVPAPWVEAAFQRVDAADALLVIGTSLTVYSGYRFVRRASERGIPIVVVNLGPTRGDPLATVHVDAPTGQVLPWLAEALGA